MEPEQELVAAIFGTRAKEGAIFFHKSINGVSLKSRVAEVLASLGDDTPMDRRQQRVLALRFGMEDGICRTLKAIGQMGEFGVTGNRIMQIEQKALRRLRHPTRSRWLKPFLRE